MNTIHTEKVGSLNLVVRQKWSAGHGLHKNSFVYRVTIDTKYGESEVSSGSYHSVSDENKAKAIAVSNGKFALRMALKRFPQD